MKLISQNGELTLPADFSFEIEQNSPFFSDNGAATIGTTIPATPADRAKLGQPTRIARKNRFVNSFPVTIQSGVFQKKGLLVVADATDTAISVSIALEDSDFYAQHKSKNLKQIFATKVLTDYSTPGAWADWLQEVYQDVVDCDFRLFPVAVDGADGEYQINNEPVFSAASYHSVWPLRHEARMVKEGDTDMSVPEGYGMAPFLKLYKFVEYIFTLCGYTVGKNCFETNSHLSSLVLLHNCSDVICNGRINYADLVPNKTVSEILEWMNKRFHAQIFVHPANKTVDILLFEDILASRPDIDLSRRVIGVPKFIYNSSSRVVMALNTGLDGAAPVADTLQDLKEKYETVLTVDESGFSGIDSPCLCLRLADGNYYEVRASYSNAVGGDPDLRYRKVKVGSNCFRYDRQNSTDIVDYSTSDVYAPMVAAGDPLIIMPYIGARIHRNTAISNGESAGKDEDQEIILADYYGQGEAFEYSGSPAIYTSDGKVMHGTTQRYNNRGHIRQGALSLVPEDIVPEFFGGFNKNLMNNAVEISVQPDLLIQEIMNYGMDRLKLFNGQRLMPVALSYEVGKAVRCKEARFRLVKDFADGQGDGPIEIPQPTLKWQHNGTEIEGYAFDLQAQHPEGTVHWRFDETDPFIVDPTKEIFLPAPRIEGESSAFIGRIIYFYITIPGPDGDSREEHLETLLLYEWFDSVNISVLQARVR